MGDCSGDVGAFDGVVVEPEGDFEVFWVHCCTDVFDEEVATRIRRRGLRRGTLQGWELGWILVRL